MSNDAFDHTPLIMLGFDVNNKGEMMPSLKMGKPRLGHGMNPCQTKLGQFIRTRRLQLGLSQLEACKLAGLQPSLISRFETGSSKQLRLRPLESLARILQCDPKDLMALIPIRTKPKSEFGKLVLARMLTLGLTESDLGQRLGWTTQLRISRLSRICGFRSLKKWTEALECNSDELQPFLIGRGFETKPGVTLGGFVRRRRLQLGLSLTEVAEALKVTRQAIDLIEAGETTLVTKPDSIEKLAKVLQVGVGELRRLQP